MMPLSSEAAVKKLLQGDYDAVNAPDLAPFIDTAAVLLDDLIEYAAGRDLVFSAAKLELIERWLAAHFYTQGDPGYTSRSTAGASGGFTGQFGMGLSNSRYGQQAMILDLSGYLRSLDKGRATAGGEWLGTPASGALTWDERNW